MKKITILLLALAIISGNAMAQKKWKIGATLGPVMSKYVLTDFYLSNYPEANTKYRLGISAGIDFYRLYGKHLMFKTGVHYNMKNQQIHYPYLNEGYEDFIDKKSFVTLPLKLQYNFKIKQHSFFVNTGAEISWMFKSVFKSDTEKLTGYQMYWEPTTELYFGIAYMYKFNEKYTLFVNPEYSPKIFTNDYSTFKLNFGVIFNY